MIVHNKVDNGLLLFGFEERTTDVLGHPIVKGIGATMGEKIAPTLKAIHADVSTA